MLVPLELPPGLYRSGTDLQASGRWRDGSLVRWFGGILQPVMGWRKRVTTPLASLSRSSIAWQDNSGDRWIAFGSYDALRIMSASGTFYDITPAGYTTGLLDAAILTGFGAGFFGAGFFGAPRPDTGNFSEATTWSLGLWGENLIGCAASDGVIYEWTLATGTPAAAISGAPVDNMGAHVTPERFLFALGAGANPRKVQWCDREDNTTWTPLATNEAGDFELQTAGQIMTAAAVRGQTLIVTDTDAHVANYIGPPLVYGFDKIGHDCGAISRRAVVEADGGAYWMGTRGFYRYFGGSAEAIQCDVADKVFSDISDPQRSKVHGVHNSQFSEIWWFYPSESGSECNSYVSFNYAENHWSFGALDRTCAIDRGVFAQPIWSDSSGYVYDHETSSNYDDSEVYVESGPIKFGGEVFTANQLIPDELTQGDVQVEFKTRFFPNGDESTFGPYAMGNPTDLRFTGRQMRMRVIGNKLSLWRWGVPSVRVSQRGKR